MTAILIAFSDTGGGHRAAAQSIQQMLLRQRPDAEITLVDPLARCGRWPIRSLANGYATIVERTPWLWHLAFRATNTPRRTALAHRIAWPWLRRAFTNLAAAHAPDAIVSTHPLLTRHLRRVYPETPLVTVVTDLVTGHVSWYDQAADVTIVPTPAARDQAIAAGVDRSTLRVLGLPVSDDFGAVPGEKAVLHVRLGWAATRPTILIAGGGEGVGPLEALCVAIDRAHLPCDIAVVAGRNSALAARLRARTWQGTVHVYPFVNNFAELMRAAAVIVTKAGPGTIAEACLSGCPIVLSGAIPGQETGNIEYVTRGRAGVWAPSLLAVTVALHTWLVGRDAPAALKRTAAAAAQLARPNAARDTAELILAVADAARGFGAAPPAAAYAAA